MRRNSGSRSWGDENVDLKAIEANSQLLSVKNKGADFAWTGGTTNSTAVILKDAKKLGLTTSSSATSGGIDETTPKLAGGAEEGALVMAGSTTFGSNVPGMKLLMEITRYPGPPVVHYIAGTSR